MTAAVVVAAAALVLVACSGDDGGSPPTEPPPGPATGTLEVSAPTTGDTLDADGYTVTLDGGEGRELDVDGTVTFEDVEEGDHELELSGVQVNCAPDGGATQTVSVTAEETATASFDVACEAALLDRIVFDSRRDGNAELYVMEPDGSSQTRLTTNTANDFAPRVSPDGTRVAFYSDRDDPGNFDVYVMGADGSGLAQLTDNSVSDTRPRESTDGSRIAFARFTGTDFDVFRMNSDGSGLAQLTTDADARDIRPDWSPDGTRLVFQTDRDGNVEVYRMDAEGGGLVNLTNDTDVDASASWTPAGE